MCTFGYQILSRLKSSGFLFTKSIPTHQTPFEKLFEIFKELITYTSGDFDEAIDWLRTLDKEYKLTDNNYTIDDFVKELLEKNYIAKTENADGLTEAFKITPKTERQLRKHAMKQVFGKLNKSGSGTHKTKHIGIGNEDSGEIRPYQYGDKFENIQLSESLKNSQIRNGLDSIELTQDDLLVKQEYHTAQMSTVLMIDISHSMILYGEDRITPAKKVALALSEMIQTVYPKDSLDILVFGNDAWPITIREIPYLQVGPYHTNTVSGLSLAMEMLRKKPNSNKQIFMITDGKPSCLKLHNGSYYKNSVGLDKTIVQKCYQKGIEALKMNIPITTFMIASDPYLRKFVEEFTKLNKGKAYYTGLDNLGEIIFQDYNHNRTQHIR